MLRNFLYLDEPQLSQYISQVEDGLRRVSSRSASLDKERQLAIDAKIGAPDVERIRELAYRIGEAQRTPVHLGISQVPGPGVAVRALSNSTEAIHAVLMAVVDELRHHLRGQKPLNLRKY